METWKRQYKKEKEITVTKMFMSPKICAESLTP